MGIDPMIKFNTKLNLAIGRNYRDLFGKISRILVFGDVLGVLNSLFLADHID